MRAVRRSDARPRPRGGYTLAELLVAAVVGGLVSTAAVVTAARVRGASGREAERAVARAQLAQAVGVVGAELAGVAVLGAAEGGDLAELSDTAVDVRAVVGGALVCGPPVSGGTGAGSTVALAAGDVAVGWWAATPRAGDVVLVHDPGLAPGAEDDAWTARAVRGASEVAAACAGGAFAAAAVAGGAVPWRLVLDGPPLPVSVGAGAPVRVLRRRRYTLYRGGDGLWALGQREWDAGGWQGIQPLAGPFDAPGVCLWKNVSGLELSRRLGRELSDQAAPRLPALQDSPPPNVAERGEQPVPREPRASTRTARPVRQSPAKLNGLEIATGVRVAVSAMATWVTAQASMPRY